MRQLFSLNECENAFYVITSVGNTRYLATAWGITICVSNPCLLTKTFPRISLTSRPKCSLLIAWGIPSFAWGLFQNITEGRRMTRIPSNQNKSVVSSIFTNIKKGLGFIETLIIKCGKIFLDTMPKISPVNS